MISNMTEYDNLPFQYILITTKKNLGLKLKHSLAKPGLVTVYIYVSA